MTQASLALIHHRPRHPDRRGELHIRDFLHREWWPGWSRIVDKLAEDADDRKLKRFREIGRRLYALELMLASGVKPTEYETLEVRGVDGNIYSGILGHARSQRALKRLRNLERPA